MAAIEINGLRELSRDHFDIARKLAEVDESLDDKIEPVVEDIAEDVLRDAEKEIARQGLRDSGDLLRSGSIKSERGKFSRQIVFDHEAAEHLEYGTRPHVIEAAPGGALAFTVPERIIAEIPGGPGVRVRLEDKQVIVDRVAHPGNEAFRFLRTAMDRNEGRLTREISKAIDEAFEEAF